MHPWIQYSYSNANNWTRKYISINKIRDYNSDNLYWHIYDRRNRVLHHLNPPSLDSKLTKQMQAWEEHKVIQRKKGT